MKKTYRILSVILSVIMIFSIIPLTASAAEISGTCGDNLTWTFDDSTGTLTISGTGEMYDYNINSFIVPWNGLQDKVKIVIITDGVTKIGACAFRNFCNMTSVTIPNGITLIGGSSFIHCTSLTDITIPDTVTGIRGSAFHGCTSLTSVTIPSKITIIEYGIFRKCTNLKSVKIPYGVTAIEMYAFDECTSLVNVQLPNSLTRIDTSAFCKCKSLTGISLPNSLTNIGSTAFSKCEGLTSVSIPASVTSIDEYAFYGCKSLTDVYYAETVEMWNEISIGENNNCLTDATIHFAKVHNRVIIPAVAATCTKNGSTEGLKCSICDMVFVEPQIIYAAGHTPGEITVENVVEATCSNFGSLDMVIYCLECGVELSRKTVFTEKLQHTSGKTVIENMIDATCTEAGGYDEVVYCSVCDEELSRDTITIKATGHTDENDDGICDTCEETFCTCNCHKTGIAKVLWNISYFFRKLVGNDMLCECGKVH